MPPQVPAVVCGQLEISFTLPPKQIRGYFCSAALAFAASPVIKVDFDMSGRNSSEVTEPNYVPWVFSGVSSKDTSLSGVKVNVSGSGNLKANWYKAGVQSPSYARLVCDGVMVENGGNITLTFSNLAAGTHSLLLYLILESCGRDAQPSPVSEQC